MGDCVSNCKGRGSLEEQKKKSDRKSNVASTPPVSQEKENLPSDPLKRYSKLKLMTEAELKVELESIFQRYDVDKDGKLNVREMRNMVNMLNQRKTGVENRFSLNQMTDFMRAVDRRGEMTMTKQEFYQFYKKI